MQDEPATPVIGGTSPARPPAPSTVEGHHVDLGGRRFYRIADFDEMPPFLMTLAGFSDVWLFISSTGGLTAGRRDADHALFPYYTEDKVSEAAGRTGGVSLFRVGLPTGVTSLWEPFTSSRPASGTEAVRRALYKDAPGTTLVFEETRTDLGLRVRVAWETSEQYGVVRTCELTSLSASEQPVEVVDGFVNLLPAGVTVKVQNELSCLLDAYKRCQVDLASGLGMIWLNSTLTDLAEPSESLHANVAWQIGLADVEYLLSERSLTAFRAGVSPGADREVRGERGAYLVHTHLTVPPGGTRRWRTVADVGLDAADVVALRSQLQRPDVMAEALDADVIGTRTGLEAILASCDGFQLTDDESATTHHLANTLFNAMRGGVPAHGYTVEVDDVRAFIHRRSRTTAERCADVLDDLPDRLQIGDLISTARAKADPDLLRLALEYLPLTFSRRHGDPSRPWNRFQIAIRAVDGAPLLDYQGNWRDIFQNWEALAWQYPEYVESMITVFLDATTADGYNPYRISRNGIDWEVPEPDNPWSNIGYWSDHQIVYLLRLLQTSQRFHPGRLAASLNEALFTHADVPYRIRPYASMVQDPFATIAFDEEHAALIEHRVVQVGSDGRLIHGHDGDLVRVTLGEKLLLLLLAKLVNLVPDGGIWMNTQRPEWNDANNALVGRGLSIVTLAQLRPYVHVLRSLVGGSVQVTVELHDLLSAVTATLSRHAHHVDGGFDDVGRRAVMDDLGEAGTAYRERVYQGFSGRHTPAQPGEIARLLDLALQYADSTIRTNRRDDALYHSYNTLDLDDGRASVAHLPEMLEGQVAVLSSGLLDAQESVSLLTSLRSSRLYRADQHSYQLYPDKSLPGFLSHNRIDPARAATCPLLDALAARGDVSVVVRDVEGVFHFAKTIHNARDVTSALDHLTADPQLRRVIDRDRETLRDLFELVFRHREFTGRSGSFFAYEGLGSIYWHMVSKLMLATQESLERAVVQADPPSTLRSLAMGYEDIRAGLGYCKDPAVYGAFPSDPYSHTPAGHGARQPGMTGQVKEELLTRLGELGLRVTDGCISFRPILLRPTEWSAAPGELRYNDTTGQWRSYPVPRSSLAFTFCQVPVVYHRSVEPMLKSHLADGRTLIWPDQRLDAATSSSIFRRAGLVTGLTLHTPAGILASEPEA